MNYISIKLFKKTIVFSVLMNTFNMAIAQTPPSSFIPEKTAPNTDQILTNGLYQDGAPKLNADLAKGNYNIAIAANSYVQGQSIVRTNTSMGNYITAGNNNYILNNTITSVQINVGSDSYAIGNTVQGNADLFGQYAKGVISLGVGAQAYDTTIKNLGTMSVNKGSEAYNTKVETGGVLTIANGYAQSIVVNGGVLNLALTSPDSKTKDTLVINGGQQNVYNGTAENSHIGSGGYQLASGKSINTFIYEGGYQVVYSGDSSRLVTDQNATIYAGGQQRVQSGISENATVYGTQTISQKNGDWENGQWVEGTGIWSAYTPTANNATIKQGGTQVLDTNGQAVGTVVERGAKQYVYKTGVIQDTKVEGGYSLLKDGAISKGSLAVTNVGTLAVEGSANQVSTIENATIDASSLLSLENNSSLANDTFVNITNLANDGNVRFGSTSLTPNTDYITLNVDNLSGSGLYTMRADMAGQQGDLLNVNQLSASSQNKLSIINQGSAATKPTDTLTVVKTNSGGQANQFTLDHAVEQGGYLFKLRQAGNNWELYAAQGGSGGKTSTALAAGNFLNISYLMNYVNTQNLMQRMGDLRNENGAKEVDFWVRGFTGKLNSFSGNLGGFDMDYRGTQMGIDKLISLSSGSLRTGVAVGYTDADPDYKAGHGSAKSYNAGLYGTYVDNNQFYIDTLLKYEHIKNNFHVKDTQNNSVSGNAKSAGYGLSVETGKRIYLQQTSQGVYLEPQAQLNYMHQEGDTVHASNGLKVKLSDYDSVLGRLSTAIGYEVKNTANPVNVYFKTGYVREFMGNNINYYLNDVKEKHNFKGNFWDNELGVSTTINKAHTFHADLHYAKGSRFDQQQINIGYRYQF